MNLEKQNRDIEKIINEDILNVKNKELENLKDINSKFIYSSNGNRILVDNETFLPRIYIKARKRYIEVTIKKGKVQQSLGRFLLNLNDKDLKVDHINRNPLDNRMSNIRVATQSNNLSNKKKTSKINKYKGYSYSRITTRIQSQKDGIRVTYKMTGISEEEAAFIYDCLSIRMHGEFAETNFPKETYTKELIDETLGKLEKLKTVIDCSNRFKPQEKRKSEHCNIDTIKKAFLKGFVDNSGENVINQSHVQKWIRDNYHIHPNILMTSDFKWMLSDIKNKYEVCDNFSHNMFDTYEDCLGYALNICIDLINIKN